MNDGQLDNWKRYLDDNPRRLMMKRLHPDFLPCWQTWRWLVSDARWWVIDFC